MEERNIATDVLIKGGDGAALRVAIEAAAREGIRVTAVSKSIM